MRPRWALSEDIDAQEAAKIIKGASMNTDKIEKINVVEVVKNLATGGSLPTRNMSKQLLAELLLNAWSALNTLKEMAKLRSDVAGFKAVIKRHLPEEYTE